MTEGNNKTCPIFFICPECNTLESCLCRKEKCAWWVEDKQKCAITAMGGEKRGK